MPTVVLGLAHHTDSWYVTVPLILGAVLLVVLRSRRGGRGGPFGRGPYGGGPFRGGPPRDGTPGGPGGGSA